MLTIINDLAVFFEDCYRRVHVREYARLHQLSPPTASKVLAQYHKEGLLHREMDRNYLTYFAHKESALFKDFSRIYWSERLKELLQFLEKQLISPTVILYGSLSKGETLPNSDIDLAIIAPKRDLILTAFEKKIKRTIQVLWCNSLSKVPSELSNNIINGYILRGRL